MRLHHVLLAIAAAVLLIGAEALKSDETTISQAKVPTRLRSSEAVLSEDGYVQRRLGWLTDWRSIRKAVKQPPLTAAANKKFLASIEKFDETYFSKWYSSVGRVYNRTPLEIYNKMLQRGYPEWQAMYIAKEFEKYIGLQRWAVEWKSIKEKILIKPTMSGLPLKNFKQWADRLDETWFVPWYHPRAPNQITNFQPKKNPLQVYNMMRKKDYTEWESAYIAKEFEKHIISHRQMFQ